MAFALTGAIANEQLDSTVIYEDFLGRVHQRRNPLSGEWVLVSPHRSKRPWQGRVEAVPAEERLMYDSHCYLCPGNQRAGGRRNPDYDGTYVFDNDFPALSDGRQASASNEDELIAARTDAGICRVICFSPRHDLTLPDMAVEDIERVVELWSEQYLDLGARPNINYVQIFENKGEMMGCSNPHPHGQIWAQRIIPNDPARENEHQEAYYAAHERTLLSAYLEWEEERQERIICENDSFVVVVPFWAVWPFETMIISRRPVPHLGAFFDEERRALAEVLKQLTTRYDNLFQTSFPYSAGIHQAPTNDRPHDAWHWHLHFYPPLLRSATVKKFMVGYEMLGMPQRDITAEDAAERLRGLSDVLYRQVEVKHDK